MWLICSESASFEMTVSNFFSLLIIYGISVLRIIISYFCFPYFLYFLACLQVGVKTWAKMPSGEYCIARIIALNNLEVAVEFEDGKTESYLLSDTGKFIPDIIPCKEDISIGTRVLAQWLDRDTLYPGVISNVRGGDNYDVLFDDGDKAKERSDQIRLMRTYSFPSKINNATILFLVKNLLYSNTPPAFVQIKVCVLD